MTSSVNNDSLEMQWIVMASALNSKLHSKIFMWSYKVIVDVVVIYCYVKKMAELEEVKKSKNHVDLTLVENYLRVFLPFSFHTSKNHHLMPTAEID